MRWTGKAILWLVVTLLVLAVVGAIYQAIATDRAERSYPPPGEMVDVGGYSLHINCVGQGSPTVVLDGGSGEMSADWVWVQREVSDTTRVCAYDRAGMGWSEMGPQPRDAKQISSELHTLLTNAGIEGPYVLVGHSFGGLYMQTYAARYPDEVAGVSLVESSHPDQFSYRQVARDSYEPQKQMFAVVSLLARLAVVSAGTQEPEWLELQDDLATLSSNSMHRVVEGATHTSVVYERSDAQATSAAIVEVVAAVRNDRPLAQQNPPPSHTHAGMRP